MIEKRHVLFVTAGFVVLGGVTTMIWLKKKRSSDADVHDDISFSASQEPFLKQSSKEILKEACDPAPLLEESNPREPSTVMEDSLEDLLNETIEELAVGVHVVSPSVSTPMDTVSYPQWGVTMKIPSGWTAVENPPVVPSNVMIQIMPPDVSEGTCILLAIEDVTAENLQLQEYVQVIKSTSIETMFYMTNGIQPMQRKDEAIEVGPFSHLLEFNIAHPTMSLLATNYIAMKNGIVYNLQMIGSPNNSTQYKALVEIIARNVVFEPLSGTVGYIDVSLPDISLSLEPIWSWKGGRKEENDNALGYFGINSRLRSEEMVLYRVGEEPNEFHLLSQAQSTADFKVACSTAEDKKIISSESYSFCVQSQNGPSRITDQSVSTILKSISPSEANNSRATFVKENQYMFGIAAGSSLISSLLNCDTVVYHPKGMPQQQDNPEEAFSIPAVMIRMVTDQSCETLEEWRHQIEEEGGNSSDDELCGQRCLKVDSTEMMEIGMGKKTEVRAVMLFFVVRKKSYVIRWELDAGEWRKHERAFSCFLDGFSFL